MYSTSTTSLLSPPHLRLLHQLALLVLGDEPALRIAVIGGGIAGLTLGELLRNTPDVEVTVYEKSVEAVERLRGYRFMLSSFVLQNLQAILPTGVWAKVAASTGVQTGGGQELRFLKRVVWTFVFRGCLNGDADKWWSSNGTGMFFFDADEMKNAFSVSRWRLRNALLQKSRLFVRFGKSCKRYERQRDDTVKVILEEGSSDICWCWWCGIES